MLAQQNRPIDAVKLLEPLFEAIEPMQETIAVRVCLLLVELYLSSHSFAQAASECTADFCMATCEPVKSSAASCTPLVDVVAEPLVGDQCKMLLT